MSGAAAYSAAMRVLDDFLPPMQFLGLRAAIEADGFPWEASAILSDPGPELQAQANRQWVHGFYRDQGGRRIHSDHAILLAPVLARLGARALVKAKVNRTLRQDRPIEYGLHVDTRRPGAHTAILYLNTNNGYTLFEDGRRVHSVANRLVLFDAARRHTGAACTDTDYRLVLNLNVLI